ncbi:MAG: transketolase [Deltaproteobacteria bacterium CG11_big_fil_rev_8_21_14_0_20_47_16]|nr:MAG: transketolase [Deltaproteobacteria bacterium CG11_big_fil_rev_8_21_14_0_20_47_16]
MTSPATSELHQKCANTIRLLAADGVEKAKSGHPGAPMGMADMVYVLWTDFLKFNPKDPKWMGRDRFILSGGHASMLLYAMLHLYGFDVSIDDLKQFRQWGSKTPGHPEFGHTTGVEVTTGPLGQGLGNAVGMAISGKWTSARVASADFDPSQNYIYAFMGDGDLMEGISHESASLAGHLKLGNLICMYDANQISIDGPTDLSYTDDVAKRFESYHWHVQSIDGHNHDQIRNAIIAAQKESSKPSIIICKTTIGFGSPNKSGKSSVHGAPLGGDEMKATKQALNWPSEPTFLVPDDVRAHFNAVITTKEADAKAWQQSMVNWREKNPDKGRLWDALCEQKLPATLLNDLCATVKGDSAATRQLSGKVLQKLAEALPFFLGGSADLTESNGTHLKAFAELSPSKSWDNARNIHFGVREHGMAAAINGMNVYGTTRAFGATFLVFSDYNRPSIRLAALSKYPSIFVFTHDSIFLGEDGPTHQAVEHLEALRSIPNCHVWRPADGLETAAAWTAAITNHNSPSCLALTRQKVPALDRPAGFKEEDMLKGAYIVWEPSQTPKQIIIATGSEVAPSIEAAKTITDKGTATRVVSMPCMELFAAQPESYRNQLLPKNCKLISVEAGRTGCWRTLIGDTGIAIGIDHFGASAPAEVLADKFGLTSQKIAEKIQEA